MEWRGPVNQLLYGLIYATALDDRAVRQMAQAIVDRSYLVEGPEVYLDAIEAALASAATLSGAFEIPHSEEQLRDFLTRLADRLRTLR